MSAREIAMECVAKILDEVVPQDALTFFTKTETHLMFKRIEQAILDAETRGRESVLSKLPAISEYMDKGLELDAQQRAEDPMAHYVEVSKLHYEWLLAKLKEPT